MLQSRHTVAEWITKQDPYMCCLQETQFRSKDTHRPKVKGWRIYFMKIEIFLKAGVAILIPNNINFKTKAITRDKKETKRQKNSTSGYISKEI